MNQADIDGDESLILRTVNLGNGHKWALEESQYYTCRAICANYMGIGGTKLADLDDDEGLKTNAMTTALKAQQMGLDPKLVLSKRFREKENASGMSTLRNPKKAKKVYQPVYIEQEEGANVEYNENAYAIYKAMFSNAARVRITGEQYKKLIGKIFETPGGIKFTSEEIITQGLASMTMADGDDSDAETVADEDIAAKPEDLNRRTNMEKLGMKIKDAAKALPGLLRDGVMGTLKTLNEHVFVPGSSGRPLIFLVMVFFMWHGCEKIFEYLGYVPKEDRGASEGFFDWMKRGFWGNVIRVPVNTNVFNARGLSQNYTAFIDSFWNEGSELAKTWNLVDTKDYEELRNFMKTGTYYDENVGELTEKGLIDVNTMMRWAFYEPRDSKDSLAKTHFDALATQSKDPEKMKAFYNEVRNQVIKLQESPELKSITASLNTGKDWLIEGGGTVPIENPFKPTLDSFNKANPDNIVEDGGTMKETEYAFESQRKTSWKVMISTLTFSYMRTRYVYSALSDDDKKTLEESFTGWLTSIYAFSNVGLFKDQFESMVSGSARIKGYFNFDATVAISTTVAVYSLYNTLRAFGSMYETWQKDNRGVRLVKVYNVMSNLTLLCTTFSLLYGLCGNNIDPYIFKRIGMSPTYVANRFAWTARSLLIEEMMMYLMGYRQMSSTQTVFQTALFSTLFYTVMQFAQASQTVWNFTGAHNLQLVMFSMIGAQGYTAMAPYIEKHIFKPIGDRLRNVYRAAFNLKPDKLPIGSYLIDGFGSLLTNMILKMDPDYKPPSYVDMTKQNLDDNGQIVDGVPMTGPLQETREQRVLRYAQQGRINHNRNLGLLPSSPQGQQGPLNQQDKMLQEQTKLLNQAQKQAKQGSGSTGPTMFSKMTQRAGKTSTFFSQLFENSAQKSMTVQQFQQAQVTQTPLVDEQRAAKRREERYAQYNKLQQEIDELLKKKG